MEFNTYLDVIGTPIPPTKHEGDNPVKKIYIPSGITTLVQTSEVDDEGIKSLKPEDVIIPLDKSEVCAYDKENYGLPLSVDLYEIPSLGNTNPIRVNRDPISKIPKTLEEVLSVLNRVSENKSSANNKIFGLRELKEIAKHLNLICTGGKPELVTRIRTAVKNHYGLK